jgi:hypothetical protein
MFLDDIIARSVKQGRFGMLGGEVAHVFELRTTGCGWFNGAIKFGRRCVLENEVEDAPTLLNVHKTDQQYIKTLK